MKLRKVQIDGKKITERVARSSEENLVIVNACVGSGKTFIAENAFGDFINLHRDNKTVQMFVTPRIRLCDQQSESIIRTLESEYGLINKKDFQLVHVDCTKNEFNWRNPYLSGNHIIFVICSENLFGSDISVVNAKVPRWTRWLKNFEAWKNMEYNLGFAAFDEAHNYENDSKYIVKTDESINKFFKVVLLSGTPSAFQKELTKTHRKNVCTCTPKEAMENKWIVKPSLNLIIGNKDTQMARAIESILIREKAKYKKEPFKPTIMVNFGGIDDIGHIHEMEYFKKNAGKKFHFVTLHSEKEHTKNNVVETLKPTIDGNIVKEKEAYNAIQSIDNRCTYFSDDLPIIVGQVQMLGEGINVNSFNACLITTNSDKTAMQQIGRIVRNYTFNGKTKINDGHANIYVMVDNIDSIETLLVNLNNYDLTDDCYSWGDKVDISTSSSAESTVDEIPELTNVKWEEIESINKLKLKIINITLRVNDKNFKKVTRSLFKEYLAENDIDGDGISDITELDKLLTELSDTGLIKLWTNQKFDKKIEHQTRTRIKANSNTSKTVHNNRKSKQQNETQLLSFRIWMNWLFSCQDAMRRSLTLRKLWKIDRLTAFKRILDDDKIAEYLYKHLSEKIIEMIEQ